MTYLRLRLAPLVLVALTFGAACLQGAKAPHVTPRGVLAPGAGEAGATPGGGPFAVVFASPRGDTDDPSEVSVVFNRPMRPLDLAGEETASPVRIRPEVPGRWNWVGTSGLVFAPEGHLARATTYTVEVPAGTKALDGSTLDKAFASTFSTPRPSVARIEPNDGNDHLDPATKFTLRTNEPVTDAELARAISLTTGDKPQKAVAFDVRRPDPANPMLSAIVPRAPFPKDARVDLVVAAGLRGAEGPLASEREQRFQFHTYPPLEAKDLECDRDTPHKRCSAESGIAIQLTNQVKRKDLERALSIEPPLKLEWGEHDDDDATDRLYVRARLPAGRTIRVRLRTEVPKAGGGTAPLRDIYGQPLAREFSRQVELDDYWPNAEIGVQGSYFEPAVRREIPVGSLNVTDLELTTAPLDRAAILSLLSDSRPGREVPAFLAALPQAKTSRVQTSVPKNVAAKTLVRTEDVLGGKDKRGTVVVATSYTSRPGTSRQYKSSSHQLVQVTDLGISAKISTHGSLVWVTRLSTGAPIARATVEIQRPDATSGTFTTDADGFAAIPEDKFLPATRGRETGIVFVRAGDDEAFRPVSDLLDGWRLGASFDLRGEHGPIGMLFTERGIYRPGDAVKIKGIVRMPAPRGTETPAGAPLGVTVKGPTGDDVLAAKASLSAFGTFALEAKVPETGKLGTYRIEGKLESSPGRYADFSGDFEVAEYRPTEFKVGVESDRPSYVRGDKASFLARGDFLFGAPMAGADVRYTITRTPADFAPPDLDGFVTGGEAIHDGHPDASPRSGEIQSGKGTLDAKGSLSMAAALAMPGQRGPERVTCEAEVTDLSRQSIASSSTAIVHPAELYVAIKPGAELFVKAGEATKPEILAVDPKGKRQPDVAVHVDLVRRVWAVARQATPGGGLHSVVSMTDQVVGGCDLTTKEAPVSCALVPPGSGYFLVHATATDRRGNKAESAAGFYALGDGETSWGDADSMKLELVTDKRSYEVGQKARILVKSPWKNAEALVTVERAGVYTRRRMTFTGSTPSFEVPVTDDLRPNAFVSVVLVRGRTKAAPQDWKAPDVGAPAYRVGYAELLVNPESRRLTVSVKPGKTDLSPGEGLDVDVDVKDRAGKGQRAEVTLYAVDEGVLSLIGYKTPDPVPVFTAPRGLEVGTLESREDLARITMSPLVGLGGDKGLDGGGGDGSARRDFRQSVYFNPTLVTDANGHAKVSFKLPESLTTYRIMAVAVAEDDRFGFAEGRVTTSRSLMARPAFPRIIRAGDSLDAGLIVTSKGMPKAKIDVEAIVDGLVLRSDAKRSIDLDANASSEVRFAFDAPRAAKAKIQFRVKGGGASDSVELTRAVVTPIVPEAVALYGDTTDKSGERLGDLSAIRDDVGGMEVSLSSTALVGLGGGVEQLIEYPYGCTEQLTSRLVPLLPLRALAGDYHLALPSDVDHVVTATVAKVLANQRGDGGFGLWPDSPEASAWVTAYALWGLGEAKRHGAPVPDRAIDEATTFLKRALDRWDRGPYGPPTAAFIVDVLADNGAPDAGWANRIFEKRAELPLFAEALLAHAMVVGKGDPESIAKLVTDLESHLRLDGPNARAVANEGDKYAVLMDSEARTSALVLRALVSASPSHPMAARLAMGLLADRRGGTWRSTQETAWALLALDDYRRAQEKAEPSFDARVFLGETELASAPFHGRSAVGAHAAVSAAKLALAGGATLAFEVDGTGRLFYEARLKYARREMPRDAIDRGFYVKKTLRAVRPEAIRDALATLPKETATSFAGGDLVLGDIVVVTPSPREFVVIDDPLPAGLEPVDSSLATTAGSLSAAGSGGEDGAEGSSDDPDERSDRIATGRAFLTSWYRRELRDDRVVFFVDHMAAGMYHYRYLARATTLGSFVLPPTRAEEMYTPEVFGRTGAALVKVSPR